MSLSLKITRLTLRILYSSIQIAGISILESMREDLYLGIACTDRTPEEVGHVHVSAFCIHSAHPLLKYTIFNYVL